VGIVIDHERVALDGGAVRAAGEGDGVGERERDLGVCADVLELAAEERRRGEIDRPAGVQRDQRVRDRPSVIADDGQLADERARGAPRRPAAGAPSLLLLT
jgi:hypothetical protein